MANTASRQPTVETIRCVRQVLRVHASQYLPPRELDRFEVRDAQPMSYSSGPTTKPDKPVRQLADLLVEICTTAEDLEAAGNNGLFRDLDTDLVAAIIEVLEAGEAHLAMQKDIYELAQKEQRRQQRSQRTPHHRDDVIECFEDAINALQSTRWAILIADGVDAPPGNRAFTSGRELVEATLAE